MCKQEVEVAQQHVVRAVAKRIEHAHFDVGMAIKLQQVFVTGDGITVVDQHADPDAPIGGVPQLFSQVGPVSSPR